MELPTVIVPDVVGQFVHIARDQVKKIGLDLGGHDPDGIPITSATWPGLYLVTSQDPRPGATAHRGDLIVVTFVDGQARSDVPVRPSSPPPALRAEMKHDEP